MLGVILIALVARQPIDTVDRTLAIVSGRTITLSDARTVLALGLIDGAAVDLALIQRLVNRELMLRETDRYEPPQPSAQQVDAAVDAARAKAGGETALARVFDEGGFTVERLRSWVFDDLRIAAYLQQRFAADERRDDLIADWLSDLRRRAQVTILDP